MMLLLWASCVLSNKDFYLGLKLLLLLLLFVFFFLGGGGVFFFTLYFHYILLTFDCEESCISIRMEYIFPFLLFSLVCVDTDFAFVVHSAVQEIMMDMSQRRRIFLSWFSFTRFFKKMQ